jgi:hypothetical protein
VYDPVIGRFLSRDPYIDGVDSSQGANGYAYVWNNPLTRWDPTGYSGVGIIYRIWCNSGDCYSSIDVLEEVVVTASRWIFEPLSRLGDINVGGIDAGAGGESGGGGSGGGGDGEPEGPKQEEPQGEESARDWWCENVPPVSASILGLEAQVAFFTVGLDINVDFGVTSHFQMYATASAAVGGGAGLGLNFLAGTGLGTGRVQTGLDAGLTTFGAVALAPGGPSGGGSIQFSGDSASVGATSIRGRGGAGFGGGLYAGVYGSGTIATPSACGN